MAPRISFPRPRRVVIETLWNVNTVGELETLAKKLGCNRDIVECKLVSQHGELVTACVL